MNTKLASFVAVGAFSLLGLLNANASGVLLTYAEAPGAQSSTLTNTSVMDFENAPNADGSLTWSGVGSYDDVAIINANK